MKFLSNIPKDQFYNQHVLLRVDWNVPTDGMAITEATRLLHTKETLEYLKNAGAKIIVLAHFGRPTEAKKQYKLDQTGIAFIYEEAMSFKPLVFQIESHLQMPIHYTQNPLSNEGTTAIKTMKSGDILLCDNVRFFGGEENNDLNLARAFANLGIFYVNDAFSCSHRAHTSTEALAHLIPAYAGFSLAKELTYLAKTLTTPKRPLWAIVGGSKVSSKIDVLLNLSQKVDGLIIGGAMAHTFLKAKGIPVGKSLVEDDHIPTAKAILEKATCEIVLPIDGRAATGLDQPYHDVPYIDMPETHAMFDIGPKSTALFKTKLQNAQTILWNGPIGVFEHENFKNGTCAIAHEIARLTEDSVMSVAGGGDTLAALSMAGVQDKLTFTSTAGGAFLEWIEGKTLPGIAVLETD